MKAYPFQATGCRAKTARGDGDCFDKNQEGLGESVLRVVQAAW